MTVTRNQPTAKPTRKVTAFGVTAGTVTAAFAIIGVAISAPVAALIATVAGAAIAYFTKEHASG